MWFVSANNKWIGRVGVLGGALECVSLQFYSIGLPLIQHSYTGAPFFAAMSALRLVRAPPPSNAHRIFTSLHNTGRRFIPCHLLSDRIDPYQILLP